MSTVYALTKIPDSLDQGLYATVDEEGNTVIQLFVDEDDAISYNVHLEALDQGLHVTAIEQAEHVDKLCEMMGYAYTITQPGEVVVPRAETLQHFFGL